MANFTPEFMEELRARLSIEEVIGRRVNLIRRGREYVGLSPFQKEKTPSFTVVPDKGFYHCFSSGEHGDIIDFVMKTEGLSFPEAVERLAAEAGLEVPVDSPEERERARRRHSLLEVMEAACAFFERTLRMPEGKTGLDYLTGRGLAPETIQRFRLGFAPDSRGALKAALGRDGISEDLMRAAGLVKRPEDGRPDFDYFRGRVMFPITDRRGRVIAFGGRILGDGQPKYLNSPETPLFAKGRVLFGLAQALPAARREGTIVVTEGYMDVIALHQAGFETAVAPLGTAVTEEQITALWRVVREPIICFDMDSAGQRAMGRVIDRALPILKPGYGLRFAGLVPGEDPDSQIRRYGHEFMANAFKRSRSILDVLWELETGGRTHLGVEHRAALTRRFEECARKIKDPVLRSHFMRGFKDRLWQQGAGGNRAGKGRGAAAAVQRQTLGQASERFDAEYRVQQILIALMVNHSWLFDEVGEALGRMSFADAALDGLRQGLVSILGAEPELEPEALREAIRARGQGTPLDRVLTDPLVACHRQVAPTASRDEARATWDENHNLMLRSALDLEIERDRQTLAGDVNQQNWSRTQLLIRAAVDDDPP